MDTETLLGLWENIAALYIAVFKKGIYLPEQAFAYLDNTKYKLTDEDTKDMIAMRKQGLSFAEIGKIYGFDPSGIFRRIKNYKERQKEGEDE